MPKTKQYRVFSKSDFPQDFLFRLKLTKKRKDA